MKKQDLDFILVPLGLAILVTYHVWLVYRILCHPTKTVIGINAINRRIWVQTIMEDPAKNGILGVQTLRNTIMASTLLASTAIMLASLIALLMTSSTSKSSTDGSIRTLRGQDIVFGNRSDLVLSIKFFSILVCFLLSFLLNVQSIRYYSHASILIAVPLKSQLIAPEFAADYVARALNKGSYFWSLGIHAFYISLPLFLWIFGPIPMIISSFVLVCVLYFLDAYSGYSTSHEEEEKKKKDLELQSYSGPPPDPNSTNAAAGMNQRSIRSTAASH